MHEVAATEVLVKSIMVPDRSSCRRSHEKMGKGLEKNAQTKHWKEAEKEPEL